MNLILTLFLVSSEGVISSIICPTAREWGLGGAGFSLARGPEAVFFNPANLGSPNNNLYFSFSYARVLLDIQQSALFVAKKMSVIDVGLGLINFDYGALDLKPDYPTEGDSMTFDANDLSLIIAASVKASAKGTAGIGFKYIREDIYIYSASAGVLNLALSYLPNQSNRVGLGIFDISSSLKMKNESFGLPVRFTFGLSNQTKKFLTGFDVHFLIRSRDWMVNAGEEFALSQVMKLRLGFRYFDGLTVNGGLGIGLPWLDLNYGFGYFPKNLGLSHYFGLAKKF